MSDKDDRLQFEFSQDRVLIYKLGRIESLLEEVKANQESHAALDQLFHAEINKRVGSLERTRAYGFGFVAVLGFIVTVVTNFLAKWVPHP